MAKLSYRSVFDSFLHLFLTCLQGRFYSNRPSDGHHSGCCGNIRKPLGPQRAEGQRLWRGPAAIDGGGSERKRRELGSPGRGVCGSGPGAALHLSPVQSWKLGGSRSYNQTQTAANSDQRLHYVVVAIGLPDSRTVSALLLRHALQQGRRLDVRRCLLHGQWLLQHLLWDHLYAHHDPYLLRQVLRHRQAASS